MRNTAVKFSIAVAALAIFFALSVQPACMAAGKGNVEKIDGLTVITVEGTPYEMGFQQGSLLKDEIKDIYDIYLDKKVFKVWVKEYSILGKGGPKAYSNPRKFMLEFSKKQEKYIPDYIKEEMKGLADGAGLTYDDVLIMSSHIDYFAVLCSTFVARGQYTAGGNLIEGRNLDWAQGGLKELDKYSAVIVRKPDKGRAYASVGYPGIIGELTTVNDAGLLAELNFSMSTVNDTEGYPALVLMKELIQTSSTIDEARDFLKRIRKQAGYNIVVVDTKKREAELMEIAANTVGIVTLEKDAFVTTNHFISKELAGKNTNASGFSSSPSPERFARLTELVQQNKGKIDPKEAMKMMADGGVKVPGTVQTVVFSPETGEFWVWTRGRADGDFVRFDTKKLFEK